MDLEDWELLPKNNYTGLGYEEDHESKKMMMINTGKSFENDYYICPIEDSVGKSELLHQRSSVVPVQLQIPITWEPLSPVDGQDQKKYLDPSVLEPDPELQTESLPSPRITFKKMKETEFADMKLDSPVRFTSPLPQNDEKHSDSGGEYYDMIEEGSDLTSKKDVDWDEGERMNLWKKSLNGIGAICSFGVAAAAATICVLFLGHNNTSIHGCRNKNQTLRFQIYSDDNKRMNEVVKHATKLNEAISVMKSLPVARAQISFGGYYDGP